jgi:hypothetical protein
MNLKQIRDEIVKDYSEYKAGHADYVDYYYGMLQVVRAMDEFFKVPENAKTYFGIKNYQLWQEIKGLLDYENKGGHK